MLKAAVETATVIASKSPIAVQGTKMALVYARDHSVPDSLEQVVRTFLHYFSAFLVCCNWYISAAYDN